MRAEPVALFERGVDPVERGAEIDQIAADLPARTGFVEQGRHARLDEFELSSGVALRLQANARDIVDHSELVAPLDSRTSRTSSDAC